MTERFDRWGMLLVLSLALTPAMADDVSGSERILCSAAQATLCTMDGDCIVGPPWNWNIPQFIEIDLTKMTLSTTEASGENRSTPIRSTERGDGLIFLQGIEAGRAFSFVIDESSGMTSIAVARDGVTVGVFGACTPIPSK